MTLFQEKKKNKYGIFFIIFFVLSISIYILNNILIRNSPVDLMKLLLMATTYNSDIALSFFRYLSNDNFQFYETITLILNIFFAICYGVLFANFYQYIYLNKNVVKHKYLITFSIITGVIVAILDILKTLILIYMVFFFDSMPIGSIYIHTTLTYLVIIGFNLVVLWFFINLILLLISQIRKRLKSR